MDREAAEERKAVMWLEAKSAEEVCQILRRELPEWDLVVCQEGESDA